MEILKRRHRASDYNRVEDHISQITPDIEFEYGKSWDDLTNSEKEEVLLDHFFKGIPEYKNSAKDMRIGLTQVENRPIGGAREIRVSHITRRGHNYTVIRDSKTGKIRQWVRE
jgi:hypothetical protein